MSPQQIKRVWNKVSTKPQAGGFAIYLDARSIATPAKTPLVLPTLELAQAIAAEWDAQIDHIDPETMPLTRTANSAIDKVALQKSEVAELLIAYGDCELLCYRAEFPTRLVERQKDKWDPVLDWAAHALGARLQIRTGIVHVAQDPSEISKLGKLVHGFSNFELAAFHDLVALTGSLILGLAATRGFLTVDELWALSRVDENWQTEQWGEDDDAQTLETIKRISFIDAEKFFHLSQEKT